MSLTLLKKITWAAAGFLILLYPTLTLAVPEIEGQTTGEDIYLQRQMADRDLTISGKELIERLTRLEEGLKNLAEQINGVKEQINDLKGFVLWGFGIMIAVMGVIVAGMFSLVGFVIWDRRTAIAPAVKKSSELEKREEKLEEREAKVERALKELALKDANVEAALRTAGIL